MLSIRSASALVGVVLALQSIAAPAQSQCFIGDDGFDLGCCTFAAPNIPVFPNMVIQADWAELKGCGPTNQNTVNMFVGSPGMVLCDIGLMSVFVVFPNGETISGTLVAKYARTWTELPAPTGQVWRFLVNGDLQCSPIAASTLCSTPLPKCTFGLPFVHFDGHVDYRCTQTTAGTVFTVSLSLNHHQGCLSHPFWSCIPITGIQAHDESSYHLVGPAPFIFGPSPAPTGPLTGDGVRPSFLATVPSFVYACASEEKVQVGNLSTNSSAGCLCAVLDQCSGNAIPCTAAGACYEHQQLAWLNCCATGFTTGPHQNLPIPVVPLTTTGFIAHRLGAWGPQPQYPSGNGLTLYFGVLLYSSIPGCVGNAFPVHVAVGVGTTNSVGLPFTTTPACNPPAPPATAFIDLNNVLPLTAAGGPGYGCLAISDVVFSFNTP